MTAKKFSNALGNIGENYINEAVTYTVQRKSTHRVLLVAVLVSIFFLMGAAGVVTIYHLVLGFNVEQTGALFSVDFSAGNAPVVTEHGRLYFIADGQHIDITDIIDENTPYIYTTVNTEIDRPSHIIIGGAPDNLGYAEIWSNNGMIGLAVQYEDISMMMELTVQEFEQGMWEVAIDSMDGLWLYNAIIQLEAEL